MTDTCQGLMSLSVPCQDPAGISKINKNRFYYYYCYYFTLCFLFFIFCFLFFIIYFILFYILYIFGFFNFLNFFFVFLLLILFYNFFFLDLAQIRTSSFLEGNSTLNCDNHYTIQPIDPFINNYAYSEPISRLRHVRACISIVIPYKLLELILLSFISIGIQHHTCKWIGILWQSLYLHWNLNTILVLTLEFHSMLVFTLQCNTIPTFTLQLNIILAVTLAFHTSDQQAGNFSQHAMSLPSHAWPWNSSPRWAVIPRVT